MSSSVKRTLTEGEFGTKCAPEWQRSDGLSSDLAARIRNASMRGRKNVTEGYRSPPPSSSKTPYSSPVNDSTSSTTIAHSLPTSNEILYHVFSSAPGAYTPLPSPSKRRRSRVDFDDENMDASPFDGRSEDRNEAMEGVSDDEEMEVERPVKPLRRSGRSTKIEVSPAVPNPPRCLGMPDVTATRQRTVSNGHCQDVPPVAPNNAPQPI
ncbi:hypothetical protein F5141DRAFT_137228 [Pisolithus sp. B1]|nr:hypothetical protein F5141DRAFT_137228 [Pisolithus sp. B1]